MLVIVCVVSIPVYLSRLRGTALCSVCAPVLLWMEGRWGRLSEWLVIWSPGEQPNPSPTSTIEKAWQQRMSRSTLLWVQRTTLCGHICTNILLLTTYRQNNLWYDAFFRMFQWASTTSRGEKGDHVTRITSSSLSYHLLYEGACLLYFHV